MATERTRLASPFCACLRSKKYYFLQAPALREDDILDGSGRTWCSRTMDALGPDGQPVDPTDCRAKRACFETHGPQA